jgi:hypothetical protein
MCETPATAGSGPRRDFKSAIAVAGLYLLAAVPFGAVLVADTPQRSFARAWQGRTVKVKSTLYSLIYNERGKLGTTRSGLREGLIVATPSQGAYFQFDGRQGRTDVRQKDLEKFVATVNTTYQPDDLDVRNYRKLEAMAINRYDAGVALVVSGVRVGRDQVTFEFAAAPGDEAVTALRIKWPVPLSKAFGEAPLIEGVLQQFVEYKRP